MDELKKLLENAGVQINERDEDVIKPVVDALLYAYYEIYYNDTDQGMNDIDRLEAMKNIAEEARHRAGDKIVNDDGREEPVSGRMGHENTLGNDHNPKYKWPGDMP